jgi:formylglycine-generating enzyme required for sulfatase activity
LEDAKRYCEFSLIGLTDTAQITDIKRRVAGLKYGIEQKGKDDEDKIKVANAQLEAGRDGMVFVKGGCFMMGDTFSEGDLDEKPVHEVCVDDFYIGKYEVTQGQWRQVMGNNPTKDNSACGNNCPVDTVSWDDVMVFIDKLNRQSLKRYRLPTEAEWEYAARSGGKREKYAGGDYIDSVAWYKSNSGGTSHPVGSKVANGLGIYDMSGNISEWCNDWSDDNFYAISPRNNPTGPLSGSRHVVRGGSYLFEPTFLRASLRARTYPDLRAKNLGFRLARSFQ